MAPDQTGLTRMRALAAGDRALLLVLPDRNELAAFVDRLREELPSGVEDFIPAAETVLVTLAAGADPPAVRHRLFELFASARQGSVDNPSEEHDALTIPVSYSGEDLEQVADLLGTSVADVVSRHTDQVWRCSFLGFAPGFGYLESSGRDLVVPRRSQSRTRVPPGAVALADGYSAVYPRESPGGWQLIGTTDLAMWDLDRPRPALLQPGTRVRFVDRDQA